jgi:CheY-like chemotaxis protein
MEPVRTSSLLSFPTDRRDHAVLFYESDDYLSNAVARFLADGLTAGQPAIAVATAPHREAFQARLRKQGFDVDRLCEEGRLLFLDARSTLPTIMDGRLPDPRRFRDRFGSAIERILDGRDTIVRAYGEMVDLLSRDENIDAAIRLEELWNDLAGTYAYSMLCGYAIDSFDKEAHAGKFHELCHAHTHVVPAEGYTLAAGEEARAREVGRLQQRARALETEVTHRRNLEQALNDALRTPPIQRNATRQEVGWLRSGLEHARVLVVDAEQDARGLLQQVLERAGASVETAASAGEAIRLISSAPFDLLVADLGMSGQDGYALIAAVRSLPNPTARRIHAIAVSVYAGHSDRAIVAGYDDYVPKPIDARRLEAVAAALLIGKSDDAS